MARQLWVVLVEDFDKMYASDHFRDQYVPYEKETQILTVFLSKERADQAAAQLAQQHPGKDVHVFAQQHGYVAPPRPVETKVWTDGKFIPGTPV